MRLHLIFGIAVCLSSVTSALASAQDSNVSIRQTPVHGVDREGSVRASQISSVGVSTDVPDVAPTERSTAGSPPPTIQTGVTPQIAIGSPSAQVGRQLAPSEPSVGPSAGSSALAQGRVTSVATPQGRDRCDPQARGAAPASCARVIEARAGEFTAADPRPLSAEQELLAVQREAKSAPMDIGAATRRLANGQFDDATSAVIVASQSMQVLNRPVEEETTEAASALELSGRRHHHLGDRPAAQPLKPEIGKPNG